MRIDNPYIEGACEECKNHFLLDGDESRCRAIKLGASSVMCAAVKYCTEYQRSYIVSGQKEATP